MERMRTGKEFDYELRDEPEFQAEVRRFFAGLDSSEERLEALKLLYGRYIYIVNHELAADLLEPLIRDADPAVRSRAARAISSNDCSERYAKELIALLDGEPSIPVLLNVALAMGNSDHQAFAPYLEKMLDHPATKVRWSALRALTWLSPMTAFEYNVRFLDDEEPSVRSVAVENLATPQLNVVIIALTRKLGDDDRGVRATAARALGQMKAATAADALKDLLVDEDRDVRTEAAVALGELRAHPWEVKNLLKDPDGKVRQFTAKAMGNMMADRYIDYLEPLLDDDYPEVRESAAESIKKLKALPPGVEPKAEE